MTSTTTIAPTKSRKRKKRTGNSVEETVDLVQILADNIPREVSDTFSVQLMSASFGGTALGVSNTPLQYTIEDASGMFMFLNIY